MCCTDLLLHVPIFMKRAKVKRLELQRVRVGVMKGVVRGYKGCSLEVGVNKRYIKFI